jgi:hypothetical protein
LLPIGAGFPSKARRISRAVDQFSLLVPYGVWYASLKWARRCNLFCNPCKPQPGINHP